MTRWAEPERFRHPSDLDDAEVEIDVIVDYPRVPPTRTIKARVRHVPAPAWTCALTLREIDVAVAGLEAT